MKINKNVKVTVTFDYNYYLGLSKVQQSNISKPMQLTTKVAPSVMSIIFYLWTSGK